ncbi:MAG: tRNA (adenosine(37)-N6)-threonylcarbamoyltransferase complex dimerization subunit type 1 TsaB [Candidatus Omnitrophota bacterium]
MLTVSCDTSTKFLNIVISNNTGVIASARRESRFDQAQTIFPLMQQMLTDCRLTPSDINAFAVGIGPGSFTGVRVGVVTFKAMAFSLDKPLAGIISLDLIARVAKDTGKLICVIVDAKKDNIYAALYCRRHDQIMKIKGYFLGKITDWLDNIKGEVVFTGDGLFQYQSMIKKQKKIKPYFLHEEYWYPNTAALYELAKESFDKKQNQDAARVLPFYLYPDDCTVSYKKTDNRP